MRRFPLVKYTCGYLIDSAIKETDSLLQKNRKEVVIPMATITLIATVCLLIVRAHLTLGVIASGLLACQSVVVLSCLIVFKTDVSELMLVCIATCSSLSVMCSDLSTIVLGTPRSWTLFVIVVDVLLLCRARNSTSAGVVAACCFHLIVVASESHLRFGFYDFEWPGYEQEERHKAVRCEKLPCSSSLGNVAGQFIIQVFIVIVDFSCTRGFAYGMAEEQNRVLASIRTANEIATSLAGFDLIQAGVLLEEAKIPPELRVAFEKLLNNLHTYAPYLPPSCIPRGAEFYSPANSEVDTQPTIVLGDPIEERSVTINQFVKKLFQQCNASLMVININNSMSVLDHSLESFEKLISALVSTTFDNVMKYKGTPDLFLGDRMFANFGASLQRSRHAHACFDCCTEVLKSSASLLDPFQELTSKRLSINVGTATGQIACGDLGSDTMLRFSLVGKLSQWVAVIERVGSFLGIQFLSNEDFHKQMTGTTESRVVLQTVVFGEETQLVFEIIPMLQKLAIEEWMYQMEKLNVGCWNNYNIVAIAVLTGQPIPQHLISTLDGDGKPYEHLRNAIKCGAPALVVKSWEA